MIRPMERDDLDACAHILMSVYNNEMWQAKWDFATARAYLLDYVAAEKFVGFVQEKNGEICGAMFCHEKSGGPTASCSSTKCSSARIASGRDWAVS